MGPLLWEHGVSSTAPPGKSLGSNCDPATVVVELWSPRYVHPEPQNVTLLGIRVLADVVKVRISS